MTLDDEGQKQLLVQVINSVQVNGNLQQAAQSVRTLAQLLQAIESADIGPQPCACATEKV